MTSSSNPHPHEQLITRRLPAWSTALSADHWQALHATTLPAQGLPGAEADWFANARPELRDALLASQAQQAASQQALGRLLKGLKQVSEFAEPLLAERLDARHGFTAPLRSTQLIWLHHRFTHQVYVTTHESRSLLGAALHNFADDVSFSNDSALALQGDWQVEAITVTGKTTLGDSETEVDIDLQSERFSITPLSLSPADFASTCRDLDLGQRYQDHLQTLLTRPGVSQAGVAAQRDTLRVAADIAHLRHQLSGAAFDVVQQLLEDGAAYPCQQPELFGIAVHGAAIIDAGIAGVLLYLPGQAVELQGFAHLGALHQQLCNDLLEPHRRAAFSACVDHALQPQFLDRARQNLDQSAASGHDQRWTLASAADLHMTLRPLQDDLFGWLHNDQCARLQREARLLAVPTAEADEQARQRRLALWENLSLNALMSVGFFIPAVGAVMLAVTAWQLLDEVYEGYEAWRVGDRHEALQHLEVVGINLGIVAGLAGAGKVVSVLASSPLMEGLDAVSLADGSQRLWQPDLAPYRSDVELPSGLPANAQGQFVDQGRHFIRLDGHLFEQRLDPSIQRWRIVHPSDGLAYQPLLEHNQLGAWRAEHEQPLSWDHAQLVRRLEPELADLDKGDIQQASHITGLDEAALREIHLNGLGTPALFADTLQRLTIMRETLANLPGASAEVISEAFAARYDIGIDSAASARLRETFPTLSAPLANRLLAGLEANELSPWLDHGRLPARIDQAVQHTLVNLAVTRGLEGLQVAALANPSSERLLFACLPRLMGGPPTWRIELRAGGPLGPVLQRAGSPQASRTLRLIRAAAGYEADLGERPAPGRVSSDLLATLLRVLPAELRSGLASDDVDALRNRMQAFVKQHRPQLNRRLSNAQARPWQHPGRLVGGLDPTLQRPNDPLRSSPEARLRRLFPLTTQHAARRRIRGWQRALRQPEAEVLHLETRLASLRHDLDLWATGSASRRRAVQPIISAWRATTAIELVDGTRLHSLDLSRLELTDLDLASLALPDDFAHISELDLSHNPGISQLPAELHERFPALERLKLQRCGFQTLPQVAVPHALTWLELDRNPLVWDDAAQARFDSFINLRVVDFSECPLGRAPDVSLHLSIATLYMDGCGLSTLPRGLQGLVSPLMLDFSRNPLVELPDPAHLPVQHGSFMRLESEHLSQAILMRIRLHYEATGIDLMVPDTDYEELLLEADATQRELLNRLPLMFRRDLRNLLESDGYLDNLPYAREEAWRRLLRMDQDPHYRRRVLSQPAVTLLDLPLEHS